MELVGGIAPGARALALAMPLPRMIELGRARDVAAMAVLAGELRAMLLAEAPQVAELERPYGRRALYAGDDGEILVMRWRVGATSAIHDHGGAAGVVVAIDGDLREECIDLAALAPNGTVADSARWPHRELRAGTAISVEAEGFHRMRAPGGGVSLHVYTPRPRGMQIADPSARCIWRVDDGHGAWLPVEPARVLGTEPWPR